jgi:hypothetical protein
VVLLVAAGAERLVAGVSVGPGQTVLIVTLLRATSRASAFAKAIVAPLQPE